MSTNRKNAPRTNLPGRAPETPPGAAATPESPEMAANGREIEISELTFQQQPALTMAAVSRNLAQAADDPSFRDDLDRLCAESHDLVRSQLQAAIPRIISTLSKIAVEAEDPALRLRAARYLATHGAKLNEMDRLHSRLQDLKESVRQARVAPSPA